jgi:copper homeostasis protein (lipoprotein)
LLETYWRPVENESGRVLVHAGTREPHVILRREGARISGYTGCNTLTGAFKHDGNILNFGKLIMTRMACLPEPGNVLEAAFVKALQSTASYRIIGESLELRDAAGMTRMRLEAR